MKRNVLILAVLVALLFVGCKQEKPKQEAAYTDYELAMTNQDTVAVTQLVNQFFDYLEHDRLSDAVAMLYKINEENPLDEPQLLDNSQIASVTNAYRMLMPIRSHKIDYIKFNQAYDNEVKVTVIMEEAHDGEPAMTTVMYFKAYDYLAEWRLCTMNSFDGSRRIISNEQADSMQQRYSEELEQKSAK